MIIQSSSPLRIGLFGGGTDVGEYAEKYGGLVLNMAINIRQIFELENEIDPRVKLERDEFTDGILEELEMSDFNLKQEFDSDFIGSGLGSSASATVALVAAANKFHKLGMTRDGIAERAWGIEVNKLGLYGGKQDQYAAAWGGINVFEFGKRVGRAPVGRAPVSLNVNNQTIESLLLFHTGVKRTDTKIQEKLKKLTLKQKKRLDWMKELVWDAVKMLAEDDLYGFGKLLHESWLMKKESNKVSNPEIDEIYERGINLGAYGGKLCGSGGGGCILFCVHPSTHKEFIETIGLKQIDYEVDYMGISTRIL